MMISRFLFRHQRWVRICFWLALITVLVLSLRPYHGMTLHFHYADKVEHFLAYLALGSLWGIGWSIKGFRPALRVFISLLVLGALIEIIQATPFIGRTASWLDLFADILGALSGLIFSAVIQRRL